MKKLLILLALTSCITAETRNILLPAAQLAWVGVQDDLKRGIAEAAPENSSELLELIEQLDEILELGGSRFLLRQIPWDMLRPYAAIGARNEAALRRLEEFSRAFEILLTAMVVYPISPNELWLDDDETSSYRYHSTAIVPNRHRRHHRRH